MAERANAGQQAQGGQISRRSQGATQGTNQGANLARAWREPFMMHPRDFFRGSPFALMRRMTEDFDRMWSNFGFGAGQGVEAAWAPAIEVAERDGNYVVHAELAGLKPEDVHVELTDDTLVIRGERKYEHKEDKEGIQRTERSYGEFYRSIPVPEGLNPEQVKAKFENGVLEVTAPMPPRQSNTRQIPIQGASGKAGQAEITH
jgi:HSP20 family protein